MVGDTSNRKDERILILADLTGEVMVYQPIAIAEISRVGARVETTFALQLDSLHDFRLRLGDRTVVVKGRIVHAHVADLGDGRLAYRAGIEFVEPSEHALEAIGEFIETIQSTQEEIVPGG